ncbi:hypothetical protein niasHS_017415 [Heterodera schachtii]|uniref:ABC transmembrane type-1 domain-containing protein n=1 Tax=Heterodera schachtii TaxID=97005 RepID=A0ABD2HZN0_HETSC
MFSHQCLLKASLFSRRQFIRFSNSELRRSTRLFRHFHALPPSGVPVNGLGGVTPSGLEMAKRLARHVWPKGQWRVKGRVLFAFSLLIAAKLLNATVPFVLRDIVDFFNGKLPAELSLGFALPGEAILSAGIALIIAWAALRSSTNFETLFLRVSPSGQSATFPTGALSKAIDRGTRGMSTTLNSLVFNILPTAFEMALVGTIFYTKCGPQFTWAMAGCLGMYATATVGITQWRTKFRLQMNEADNEAGNRAIDSLINYETVKYFNNERLEADRYDYFMRRFEHASLKTSTSLALLNFTQSAIFSAGLVGVMCLAAFNVQSGVMSVGDIVLVNTLLFQMSIPLNFLGSVYRDIRQGI